MGRFVQSARTNYLSKSNKQIPRCCNFCRISETFNSQDGIFFLLPHRNTKKVLLFYYRHGFLKTRLTHFPRKFEKGLFYYKSTSCNFSKKASSPQVLILKKRAWLPPELPGQMWRMPPPGWSGLLPIFARYSPRRRPPAGSLSPL